MYAPSFLIGNQTARSASDVLEPFRFALGAGFCAFEWFSDKDRDRGFGFSDLDLATRRSIRAEARSAGVRSTVHAPVSSSPLHEAGRRALRESLEFARDVGAELVNLHLDLREGADAFAHALSDLVRAAEREGISLTLENLPEHGPAACNAAWRAIAGLSADTAGVGFCLDVGHANLCTATRNDYVHFVDALDPSVRLRHVHLHENWGDHDAHLCLFTGPSRTDERGPRLLLERLAARGFSGCLILEQWPSPPALLTEARDRLHRLLRGMGLVPALPAPAA